VQLESRNAPKTQSFFQHREFLVATTLSNSIRRVIETLEQERADRWRSRLTLVIGTGAKVVLSSLEDGLAFFEEGLARFLCVLAAEGDANIGQLVAELLFHVARLQGLHHAALEKPKRDG
jgi:hypothetical protein